MQGTMKVSPIFNDTDMKQKVLLFYEVDGHQKALIEHYFTTNTLSQKSRQAKKDQQWE